MTKTRCLGCKTIPCSHGISCRTEPQVSWCKQKPNERYEEAEYPKTKISVMETARNIRSD